MLSDNQYLKVRPILLANRKPPDDQAIEFKLYDLREGGVYERSVCTQPSTLEGDFTLGRAEGLINYLSNSLDKVDKGDLAEMYYSYTPNL